MTQLFGISTDVLLPRKAPWGFTVTKEFLQEVQEPYARLIQAMDRLPQLRTFFQQAMDRQDFSGIFADRALSQYQGTVLKVFFPPSQKDIAEGRTHGTSKMGMLKAFLILYCDFSDAPNVDLDNIYNRYAEFFVGLKGKGMALANSEDFRAFARRLFFLKFNMDICDLSETTNPENVSEATNQEPISINYMNALVEQTLLQGVLPLLDVSLQSLVNKRDTLKALLEEAQAEVEAMLKTRAEVEDSFRQEEELRKGLESLRQKREATLNRVTALSQIPDAYLLSQRESKTVAHYRSLVEARDRFPLEIPDTKYKLTA